MKKLLQTAILAGVVAITATSGAYAKSHPRTTEQQRIDRNAEYWNGKNTESSKTSGERQVSDTGYTPKASEYPCGNCVYDSNLGGYVQKTVGKR